MDGGRPLNKNHELSTVGASNLIAGLAGGFTGSYIFSQAGASALFCVWFVPVCGCGRLPCWPGA